MYSLAILISVAVFTVGHTLPNHHRSNLAQFEASDSAKCALTICSKECVERANKGGTCYPHECRCVEENKSLEKSYAVCDAFACSLLCRTIFPALKGRCENGECKCNL